MSDDSQNGDGGRRNSGFDALGDDDLGSSSNNQSSAEEWKKYADKTYDEYLSNCPGRAPHPGPGVHGDDIQPPLSSGHDEGKVFGETDEPCIEPQEPSENKEQFLRYVFHLFVEENVQSVKIVTEKPMLSGSITMPLKCDSDDRKYWKSSELFIHANEEDTFRYRYVIKYKEGLLQSVTSSVMNILTGNKDEKAVQEKSFRKLNMGMHQYDIFHNPSCQSRMRSVFAGHLYFVKLLCQELMTGGDLRELLIECEHIGFGHPSYSVHEVKLFLNWVKQLCCNNLTPHLGVYLSSLLGQLVERGRNWSSENTCTYLGRKTADSILVSFCSYSYMTLPKTSTKYIKIVAEKLFEAGSSEGSLLFIKYFCHLLDVNHVMLVADRLLSRSYTDQQFDQQSSAVLDSLKRLSSDSICCSRYCSHVINCSPSVPCLWNMYDIMSSHFPQLLPSLIEEFASVYCKSISSRRARKHDLLQSLFWCQVPEIVKERVVNPFCGALADQIALETIWSQEKRASLKTIVLDARLQSSDHFHRLITSIVTHKHKEVVSIFPELLNSTTFCSYWETNTSQWHKEDVGRRWLIAHFDTACKKPEEKVLDVVEACDLFCNALAVKVNRALRQAMDKEVERLVHRANLKSVMVAFRNAERCAPPIQERLSFLLKSVAKQTFGTGDCRSRFRQMIHLLGFDVSKEAKKDLQKFKLDSAEEEVLLLLLEPIQMPGAGDVEGIVKAIMSASDIWLPIFKTLHSGSIIMRHPKVVAVVDALKCLTNPHQRLDLPLRFFLPLADNEINLLARFCALASTLEKNVQQHEVDDWTKQLTTTRSAVQTFSEQFSKLERTIRFLESVSKDIVAVSDAQFLISEVNKRRKLMNATTIKDILDDNFWGELRSLIESEEGTTQLQASFVFANVARRCLTEEVTASQTAVEVVVDMPDINPEYNVENATQRTAAEILFLLEKEGMHRFKEEINNLFDKSKDPSTKEVDMLLRGIADEDRLQREVQEIRAICGVFIPRQKVTMLINHLHFPVVLDKVEQLMSVFSALGFDDAGDAVTKELQDFISCSHACDLTLSRLSEIVENKSVAMVSKMLDETLMTIIKTLQESSELISFMKETAGEDIRILIDAVEEHSDQFVSEATVSDLIDVHGFLRNVLRERPKDPLMFLSQLESHYKKLEKKEGMAAKIKECGCNVHSLRGLYMNVANRGEMTKEMITNAVQRGCYLIKAEADGSFVVQLSYHRQKGASKETIYNMAELHDLRSRALLIVNTDKMQENRGKSEDIDASLNKTLSEFIQQVERITDILNMITLLRESGHPQFDKTFWQKLGSSKEIESVAACLEKLLRQWENILHVVQRDHYFLNFFHPDQLWILHKFFSTSLATTKEVIWLEKSAHSLLRYVDPTIKQEDLRSFHRQYEAPKTNCGHESDLRAIGEVLDAIFIPRQTTRLETLPHQDLQRAVKPGELFVAVLEQGSKQAAHVVMSLFENTTGSYPQPSQVLFCHAETSWEEVDRLLKRAFEAHRHSTAVKLHCLANVENLSNDMQFELVAAIKSCQQTAKGPFLLSIVCCGGVHHHIADQFSTAAHNVMGMSEVELRNTFKLNFSDVFMVTSDLPGVGKTEAIHEHATGQKKRAVTIPISGPLTRKNLVKRLSGLQCCPYECIHFDIGEVDDPSVLDTFIFELVVVGMVSSGTDLFHLPTKHVYIEIANTLRHWLQDSLPVTKCFSPLRIKLDGYKDLVVSQEALSPIQVVCQYLHAFESGTLESKDLRLDEMQPVPPERCKVLLSKHFSSSGDLSYNIVESFIKVFANQLLQFSASPYFKPHNLRLALGPSHDVRSCLFKALLEVSREFASRSVVTCKNVQAEAISKEQATEVLKSIQLSLKNVAEKMVERVEGMIQWADNNHLVIVFHSLEALTISALYRELALVPSNVHELFKSQAMKGKDKGMDDFSKMGQKELQQRLDRIVRTTPRQNDDALSLDYALTPDNILKMVLIIQRIRAGIPVIVMGETGCGKTSLVRYLARTCGVPFHAFNFHAGISEEEVINFVSKVEKEAESGQDVWVFLDEINTCEYLGTINEMICHHRLKGTPLVPNLVFMAACNPYRLRPPGKISTAGLTGKTVADEYSRLVYRVHPLPETMIDFVWDYGSLSAKDECAYIGRMVEGITGNADNLLVQLLCISQRYIREAEKSSYCVSLRDAHRCIVLVKWFKETLHKRKDLPLSRFNESRIYHTAARNFSHQDRSYVLALAHCYQSRLPTAASRKVYREQIACCFRKHKMSFQDCSFEDIVRAEQDDYLERMELPEGTAKNAALRENVFVMLVCILNRIPVFVVGKPGCSKSLSMQIIRSNLRGKDAKDVFLKTLPQLYVVSHQGSESSTSDGILKVFDKARKYREHNTTGDVLPVVLLDEIGLAEISKYNPLKVLHSLLEPGDGTFPNVAVVGISNWALDAAKMNRAIHLSRPEPDVDDLFDTGKSLRGANSDRNGLGVSRTRSGHQFSQRTYPDDKMLHCLAEAYKKYQESQRYANFHGLRDYYSLIKCLSTEPTYDTSEIEFSEEKTKGIQHALQRNFGGVPKDVNDFQTLFQEGLQMEHLIEDTFHFPVTELICDNLHDKLARHLMIITNGDSAIGILDQTLQGLLKEKITIFGSRFEEDLSEEYNYRILSRIILCMERDCILILRDLESIYGSLYDMLNQNYTVVGGKRNCRVALGAFSNPMCQVHDGFRCIVLIDQGRIDFTDPPFLNRFEKQLLRFSDVLSLEQREIIGNLNKWVEVISTIPNFESQFHEEDMFVGFCDDTLPSLVLKNSQDSKHDHYEILEQCKQDLMMVASPDGVVRSLHSVLAETDFKEVQRLYKSYFQKPVHNGFKNYLKHLLANLELLSGMKDATDGMRLVVMTHSNIHVNVSQYLEGLVECQTEKLSAFRSEKQLTKELERFWKSNHSLLVLQCKPELDATHMLLAKSIIEQQREKYIKEEVDTNQKQLKHVCIIIHVQRESDANAVQNQPWQFSFQSGWRQVTIDVLEDPVLSITECLDVSIIDLLESKALAFEDVASNQFMWCFTRIKYPATQQPPLDTILQLEQQLRSSLKVLECFKTLVKRWLGKRDQTNSYLTDLPSWQYSVACDRQALINSSHLVGAIQHYVSHLIRNPLAKIVYFLEKESAWPRFLFTRDTSDEEELQVWVELMLEKNFFDIDDIPDHQGAESYFISEQRLELRFPCASVFYKKVEQVQPMFAEDQRRLLLDESNLDEDGELLDDAAELQLRRFASVVKEKIPQVFEIEHLKRNIEYYVEDLLDMKTGHFSNAFTRAERIDFLKSAMAYHIKFPICGDHSLLITRLHSLFWLNERSYMAVLQVYETCHKVPSVDLADIFSKYSQVFQETLFQDTTSTQSNLSEDAEETERSTCLNESLHDDCVDAKIECDSEKGKPNLVIVEESLPCNQTESEPQSTEMKEGEETMVEEGKDEVVNKVMGIVCEVRVMEPTNGSTKLVQVGKTEGQDEQTKDETEPVRRHGLVTEYHHEGVSGDERDGKRETLSESNNGDRNQTLGKTAKDNLQGTRLDEDDKDGDFEEDEDVDKPTYKPEGVLLMKENDERITEKTQEQSSSEEEELEEEAQEIAESISDNEESTVISFDEEVLDALCSALLPTPDVVHHCKGADSWQRTTSLFLSTASRIQIQIPAFHYLRVCYDFVNLLVLPEALDVYSLYMLGELGKTRREGFLDSLEIFDRITGVTDELEKRGVQTGRLVDFLMLFYGRCIDSNPDTPLLGYILERIYSSREKSLMRLAGPLVHRILLMEEQICPGVFENLLHSVDTINEHPGLQEISCAIDARAEDVEVDLPFAVVCCDLIGEVAFLKLDFSTVSSSGDEILLNFRKAFQILVSPCNVAENGVFHLLCAIAFLRSFLASFVKFILDRRQCLVEDGQFSMLVNEVNAALSLSQSHLVSSRVSELRMYFLRELKRELYMFDVHQICQQSPKLDALKSLDWHDEDLVGKLSFDPFQNYTENCSVQAALATLLDKNNPKPLDDIIRDLPKSAEQRFTMAATLAKSFYLVRSKRQLRDSEDKAIDSFKGKLVNLETPYVELLLRITGRKDFKCPMLCISSESSPADVHKAILILHLCIILASKCSTTTSNTPAFMTYLTNPLASQNSFVLAAGESPQQPYKIHCNYIAEHFVQLTTFFCSCGTAFVIAGQETTTTCPTCRSECQEKNKGCKNEGTAIAIPPSTGYVCLASCEEISHHVRELEPAEFRVLHLFVSAALYGGYSLEMFDEKCLSNIMNVNDSQSNPRELCFQWLDSDLKALCSILDAKQEDVIRLLHSALEETTSLLTSAVVCRTEDARLVWERKFSTAVCPLLQEFCQRKRLARSHDMVSRSSFAVQRRIEETDCPQFSGTGDRNLRIPRLFRMTCPKTFSSLRAYYMAAGDEEKNTHPLVGLFLDYHSILPLVANLNHLLSWSRVVDSLLSRRLSRKDAATKIGDIIRREAHSSEEKKRLNETFDKFTEAWEKLRPFVKVKVKHEVPHLSESSPISYCLIEKRNHGVFLCAALGVLQNIQNEFLRKILTIAATRKCSALVFLQRDDGKCAIPMVPLQEAREKEIIHYQWSDEILRHSQHNTEYGHGKEIFFDLAKIEKEMAARFLVGKSFLSTFDGLHEFLFSQELFHTCRGILDDLQGIIPQQPLTDVFRSSLRQCEHSFKSIQDLLEHMEIVLCLLKRQQTGKPEEPLTEFTDKWIRGSRPFPKALLPQPHSAIQLTHVVALYQFLEDILAESAAKRVHDVYRAAIPAEKAQEMVKAASTCEKPELERTVLNGITTAIRRFIFRYLTTEEIRPESSDSLVEHMLETSLWPIDAFASWKSMKVESSSMFIRSVFPETLTVGNTFDVLCLYQDRLKVLEEAKQVSRTPAPRSTHRPVTRSRQLKGRAQFSFS